MTKDDAIRGAVDKIETVIRWINNNAAPPAFILCIAALDMVVRDLNAALDQEQKDDKGYQDAKNPAGPVV